VLVGVDAVERHAVADLHRRQLAAHRPRPPLVLVSLPSSYTARKPGSTTGGARGAEAVLVAGGQVDRHRVERGGDHLRGNGTPPDEFVELASSSLRKRATCAGVRSAEVGRTASCASCAFFDLVV
jgi:hypothetical protein